MAEMLSLASPRTCHCSLLVCSPHLAPSPWHPLLSSHSPFTPGSFLSHGISCSPAVLDSPPLCPTLPLSPQLHCSRYPLSLSYCGLMLHSDLACTYMCISSFLSLERPHLFGSLMCLFFVRLQSTYELNESENDHA